MSAWLNRVILAFCTLLAFGVLITLVLVLIQTQAERQQVSRMEKLTIQRLAEARQKLAEQAIVLKRLRTDPVYVEMILRRRLGYTKPDEVVFRFEE